MSYNIPRSAWDFQTKSKEQKSHINISSHVVAKQSTNLKKHEAELETQIKSYNYSDQCLLWSYHALCFNTNSNRQLLAVVDSVIYVYRYLLFQIESNYFSSYLFQTITTTVTTSYVTFRIVDTVTACWVVCLSIILSRDVVAICQNDPMLKENESKTTIFMHLVRR